MPAGLPAERREAVAKPESDQRRVLEQTCRRLRLENARLREELHLAEKYGVSPIPVSKSQSAGVPAVVRAALVSRQTLSHWQSLRHLNQGRAGHYGVVDGPGRGSAAPRPGERGGR